MAPTNKGEKKQTPSRTEKVIYGTHFEDVIPGLVDSLGAQKVFIVVSKSLHDQTDEGHKLEKILGDKFAGKKIGIRPHTPYEDIVPLTKAIRESKADLVITLGAGSITDAVKVAILGAANGVEKTEDLDKISASGKTAEQIQKLIAALNPPTASIIYIPTSLSAGEYNGIAGATDPRDHHKKGFLHPAFVGKYIVLDPWLVQTTPEWVYLSTGVRAIDHAVETLASLKSGPNADKIAEKALSILVDSLLRVKKNPRDPQARTDSQLGARKAFMAYVEEKIPLGGSHAIGHVLGSVCGVAHGHTSCVMLPSVMRYNFAVNKERQDKIKDILLRLDAVKKLLPTGTDELQVADILETIFRALGMPTKLHEVNVDESKFQGVAHGTLKDSWAPTNPRPLISEDQIMEILQMAK